MEKLLENLNKIIDKLLGRLSCEDQRDVPSGTTYTDEKGFFMYVVTDGSVKYDTMKGTTITKNLIAGWHPIKVKKIYSSTAVDILASYP